MLYARLTSDWNNWSRYYNAIHEYITNLLTRASIPSVPVHLCNAISYRLRRCTAKSEIKDRRRTVSVAALHADWTETACLPVLLSKDIWRLLYLVSPVTRSVSSDDCVIMLCRFYWRKRTRNVLYGIVFIVLFCRYEHYKYRINTPIIKIRLKENFIQIKI